MHPHPTDAAPAGPDTTQEPKSRSTAAPQPDDPRSTVVTQLPHLAGVLDAVVEFTTRYVAFASSAQATAVALWVAHTHVIDHIETTPYLAVTSPEPRSGKYRLFEVLELVVRTPWHAVDASEATVFRKVSDDHPTLLFDEVDTIFGPKARGNEGLRAVLNAGHRVGATVPRCVSAGGVMVVEDFEVFCAKALAAIGDLPATVADRCIPIRVARRARSEPVERFRYREATAAEPLRQALSRWAAEYGQAIGHARPAIPPELDDRAADGWEPLLAIADLAGRSWPQRARRAALELHATVDETDTSPGLRLLDDLRTVFEGRQAMRSTVLLDRLKALDDAPWAERHLTPRRLATMLRAYGVERRTVRLSPQEHAKGYRRDDLAPVWERYLPPASNRDHRRPASPFLPGSGTNGDTVTPQVTGPEPVTEGSPQTEPIGVGDRIGDTTPAADQACHRVTDTPLPEEQPVPRYTAPPSPCEVCAKRCAVTIAGRRIHVLCERTAAS